MKKNLILILTLLMIYICSSCKGQGYTPYNDTEPTPKKTEYKEENTDIQQEYKESIWEIQNYKDKFGDSTSEKFIMAMFDGTFNNSATKDSDLTAAIRVNEETLDIILFEYGNADYRVQNIYSETRQYNLSIKDSNGEIILLTGFMYSNGDSIHFMDDGEKNSNKIIFDILKGGDTVRFYIEDADHTITNYLFSVDATGFLETYQLLFPFSLWWRENLEETETWGTEYYLDKFQTPSSDLYITNRKNIYGSYSVSTIGETGDEFALNELLGQSAIIMLIDENDIMLALFQLSEYGTFRARNNEPSNPIIYYITMLLPDGTQQDITGTMYCHDNKVYIDDIYKSDFINALCENEVVNFCLKEYNEEFINYCLQEDGEYMIPTFLLSIETNNFADVYMSTFPSEQPIQSAQSGIRGKVTPLT